VVFPIRPGFLRAEKIIIRIIGTRVLKNPTLIYEDPINDEKYDMCFARRIRGHIFYDDSVNAARYVNKILRPPLPT
jgi:hypothetical protein